MLITASFYPGWKYNFSNGQTDSNLFIMSKNKTHDILVLGSSHGRMFAKGGMHDLFTQMLGKSVINLSVDSGGIYLAALFFDYYFSLGNKVGTIFYFMDPWAMYVEENNEKHDLNEPLDWNFLSFILGRGVAPKVLFNYFHYKTSWKWISQTPNNAYFNNTEFSGSFKTNLKLTHQLDFDSIEGKNFMKNKKYLYHLSKISKEKDIRFIVIMPPVLRGVFFAQAELIDELKKMHDEFGTEYYDFSTEILDPHLYRDISHLNKNGLVYFTEKYLKPILDNQL